MAYPDLLNASMNMGWRRSIWSAMKVRAYAPAMQMCSVMSYAKLDKIVQSSALVECINSIIRSYLNTTKNHVTQELLNLVMHYHNHRRYRDGVRRFVVQIIHILYLEARIAVFRDRQRQGCRCRAFRGEAEQGIVPVALFAAERARQGG